MANCFVLLFCCRVESSLNFNYDIKRFRTTLRKVQCMLQTWLEWHLLVNWRFQFGSLTSCVPFHLTSTASESLLSQHFIKFVTEVKTEFIIVSFDLSNYESLRQKRFNLLIASCCKCNHTRNFNWVSSQSVVQIFCYIDGMENVNTFHCTTEKLF